MVINERIKTAAIAGICFVLVSALLLFVPTLYQIVEAPYARLLMLDIILVTSAALFVTHMRGYVYVAEKFGHDSLKKSCFAMILAYIVFASVSTLLQAIHPSELTGLPGSIQGFVLIVYLVCALVFAVILIRIRQQTGVLAVVAPLIGIAPVFFFGGSWILLALPIPSILFLLQVGRR